MLFCFNLCFIGSGDIPEHLKIFEKPWTPVPKRPRRTKAKNGKVRDFNLCFRLDEIVISFLIGNFIFIIHI